MIAQPNERSLLVMPKIKIIHNVWRLYLRDIICLEQYTSNSNYLTTSKSLSLYWSVTTSIEYEYQNMGINGPQMDKIVYNFPF